MGDYEPIFDPILGKTRAKDLFTGSGLLSINGLTPVAQLLAVASAGSDFNIVSSGATHTFNLPTASALNRGALSSTDWTTFNNKLSNISGQDHSTLNNLDYASAGHTGFEKSLTFSTGLTRTVDTITTNDSQIVHDNLSGFVANEHIDHSGVNINAGGILSGGGDITTSRTITLNQSDVDHDLITNTHNLTTDIDHDQLLNYVAGEHFLQSAITQISAGVGDGLVKSTSGTLSTITDNSTNWNTAYGWGDHSVEGYLKNIVEDTTPQLGGNLDGQTFNINTTGDISGAEGTFTVGNVEGVTVISSNSGFYRLTTNAGGTNSRNWGIATEYNAEGYFEILRSTTVGGVANTPAFRLDKDSNAFMFGDLNTNSNDIKFLDNDKAIFGTGLDAEIFVDSSDNLNVRSLTQDKDIFISVNNGGGDTELMRFKGSTSKIGIFTSNPVYEFQSSATENGYLRYTNLSFQSPNVFFARSRGTEGSPTIVQNGDKLGTFAFLGYDGVGFSTVPFASTIIGYVDGTPAAGSVPARIEFATQPQGGTGATKIRKIIRSTGLIEFKQTAGASEAATTLYEEKDTTPANPTSGTEVKMYMKDDKFIWQFNNGGTVRYFYIDLTQTAAQQVQHTTTAP